MSVSVTNLIGDVLVATNSTSYGGVNAGDDFDLSCSAPSGYVVVAGGAAINNKACHLVDSKPDSFNGAGLPTAWRGRWQFVGSGPVTVALDVWAICVRVATF